MDDELDLSEDENDELSLPVDIQGIEEDIDDEFETVDGEVDTKLDLAQAYLDMGDLEGAEDLLKEVMEEGDENQKSAAEKLLQNI
ncbi:FimV/HubP family polar landmark protein [Eionea flava]